MAATAVATPVPVVRPAAIPIRDVVPWLVFAAALGLVLLYFIGVEQGAFSIFSGRFVHEFVHDGRHLLGIPCH